MTKTLVGYAATVLLTAGLVASAFAAQSETAKTPLSSFIDGEIEFEADPDLPKAYRYVAPGKNLGDFDKVMLEPIEIFVHDESPYKGINADDIRLLSERFGEVMRQELEPDYPLVSSSGVGVAVVHIAIGDVKLGKKKRGLLGYTPIGFVATAAMDAAGQRVSLLDAKVEAEVLDGASGERVGALVDFSFQQGGEKKGWSDIEARLRLYAKRFRNLLDIAHGREPRNTASEMPSLL